MSESERPVVAAFDLDGTLTQGGSVYHWLRYLAGDGTVYRATLTLLVPLGVGAVRSGRWADDAKERLFHKILVGRDLEEVRQASRTFAFEHLAHKGRKKILERLEWHRESGHDVVIVSASPQLYVDVMVEATHATAGMGTRLAVDARSKLTGGYLGKNCRGGEKMRRLDEWIGDQHYPETPVIYAYGNSRGDRRLLKGATYPFDVGRLGMFGALRNYPRLKKSSQ
ncbi:MAG: HAD-IB family hydrolase [Acidobacteria bacterium]|nr:HAD-IB family hydrolase [Acidobacteriota bacterium]